MKSKIALVLCLLILVGCGSKSEENKKVVTDAINTGDYQIIIPFESSDSRQTHVEYNRGSYDINAVGKGLLEFSKDHFSTDSYYAQEGKLLTRDILQVGATYGDTEGILGFKSSENNYGLNPEKGTSLPISDSETITTGDSTIPLVDIFEIDFYKSLSENAEIEGLSFCLVLNPTVKDKDGVEKTIKDEQLKTIGEEASRSLISYLQSMPEVGTTTPILITLFKADSSDSSLAGSFIAKGYGRDGIDSFSSINEEWAIFPSDSATELDSVSSSQFSNIQQELHLFLPNDVGIVGKGKFTDSKLDTLYIYITAQTKTYTECVALVQYTKELLSTLKDDDIEIIVKVNNNDNTFAMLHKKSGESSVTVIME